MLIVPGLPPLQPTRHSRELGRKFEQLVRDYQRDHPDVTESDVRAALSQLTTAGEAPGTMRRRRVLGIGIGALTAAAFGVMASTGGGRRIDNDSMVWMAIGVVAAVCGIAITAIWLARRS